MKTQVAGLTLIVAQETDQTGRQITTMIVVLLVIALLLGLLTAWYWRHTDPRRRAQLQAEARRAAREAEEARRLEVGEPALDEPAPQQVSARPGGTERAVDSVWADETVGGAIATADDDGVSDDEWLRLTGPKQTQQRPQNQRPQTQSTDNRGTEHRRPRTNGQNPDDQPRAQRSDGQRPQSQQRSQRQQRPQGQQGRPQQSRNREA